MRFLRRSLMGLFLLAATLGLLAFSGKMMYDAVQVRMAEEDRQRPARERVLSVNVITVETTSIAPKLTAFGEVRSRRTLDLRSSASGQIIEIADGFEDGGRVTAGQLLARIDPSDPQARLDVASADMSEAQATLREAGRAVEITRDELLAAQEQARLRDAALDRARDLRTRGVGTEAAVETAELAVSSAGQAVLARRQSLANAQSQLDRATTSLDRQAINLAEAKRALSETEIFADFTGTLTEVSAAQGSLVSNNERIARIIDTNDLELSFRVSTPQYARLLDENGALIRSQADVALDTMGVDLATTATITRESAEVGAGQTGRLLFARLDKPFGLRPGDFVTISITEPVLDRVAQIPATAFGNDQTVLVIGEDNRLSAMKVDLLRRQGDHVLVRARGLNGLTIVAERSPLLGVGIKVQPITPPTAGDQLSDAPAEPEMITLSPERKAKLVAFIEGNNRMPADAKERILTQLEGDEVPAQVVTRLESRMGG